jgi:hypothetical protein
MTSLHEEIGHASDKLNSGMDPHKETLKNSASTLEEARTDPCTTYPTKD